MRKIALLLTMAFALLVAGGLGFQADAAVGCGTQGLRSAVKNFSPIDRVACRFAGPMCPEGYTRICRPFFVDQRILMRTSWQQRTKHVHCALKPASVWADGARGRKHRHLRTLIYESPRAVK